MTYITSWVSPLNARSKAGGVLVAICATAVMWVSFVRIVTKGKSCGVERAREKIRRPRPDTEAGAAGPLTLRFREPRRGE